MQSTTIRPVDERLQALAELLMKEITADGAHETAVAGLALIRASAPTTPLFVLHKPALCLVVQGRKRVVLGDLVLDYDRARCLVVSVDLPLLGEVTEASVETPYLCLRIDLDPVLIGEILTTGSFAVAASDVSEPGLGVRPASEDLIDVSLRMVRLLDRPSEVATMLPLLQRELSYRLLTGDYGEAVRQIAVAGSRLRQITGVIAWIREHFAEPLSIERLADMASLSESALHRNFKIVTRMSPLQFQKQLRLQQARKLLLARAVDAASAGYEVGYGSATQFSREYARLFGMPPARDAARLRQLVAAGREPA